MKIQAEENGVKIDLESSKSMKDLVMWLVYPTKTESRFIPRRDISYKRKPRTTVKTLRSNQIWTQDEDDLLIQYRNMGLKHKQIARKLNRSERATSHRLMYIRRSSR